MGTSSDILFVAKDAVDNIARIKAASWRALAVEGAVFAFFVINSDKLSFGFASIAFTAFTLFLCVIVCVTYPLKLLKYRNRLAKCSEKFDEDAKKIYEKGIQDIKNFDFGDWVYIAFSLVYFISIFILYTSKFGEFSFMNVLFETTGQINSIGTPNE